MDLLLDRLRPEGEVEPAILRRAAIRALEILEIGVDHVVAEHDAEPFRLDLPGGDAGVGEREIGRGEAELDLATHHLETLAGPDVDLRIEVGDVPTSIAVGDSVRIVLVPDPSVSTDTAVTEFDQPATVWEVEPPSETNPDYVVSLKVPSEFLAKAAVAERTKIALIGDNEEVVP